jgi:hypothetical protein
MSVFGFDNIVRNHSKISTLGFTFITNFNFQFITYQVGVQATSQNCKPIWWIVGWNFGRVTGYFDKSFMVFFILRRSYTHAVCDAAQSFIIYAVETVSLNLSTYISINLTSKLTASKLLMIGFVGQMSHIVLLGFWTFSIVRYSREQKTRRFGSWIYFCPQVKGEKTPTHLCPSERANLNHWTESLMTETGPVSETSCFLFSRIPDDGKKPKNPVILCVIRHRQNPLESKCLRCSALMANIHEAYVSIHSLKTEYSILSVSRQIS